MAKKRDVVNKVMQEKQENQAKPDKQVKPRKKAEPKQQVVEPVEQVEQTVEPATTMSEEDANLVLANCEHQLEALKQRDDAARKIFEEARASEEAAEKELADIKAEADNLKASVELAKQVKADLEAKAQAELEAKIVAETEARLRADTIAQPPMPMPQRPQFGPMPPVAPVINIWCATPYGWMPSVPPAR